jgi:hypothetical protein
MPEEYDEVGEQGEGPDQEAHPRNFYATQVDVYALKGTINNIYNGFPWVLLSSPLSLGIFYC